MIPIFKYEQEAGIADVVRSSGSITFAHQAKAIDIDNDQKEQLKQLLEASAEANPNQFDLFYLESILASAGWNQNDDVFEKEEIWTARNTPVDKKFNYMHDEADIIGHLTSSKVVDTDGKAVADASSLPEQFDVVVGSVLYRTWQDPQLQERMNKLIAEIVEGKWHVSMECLFRNFDYAVVTPDGSHKIIARNDQTSFLTKHLRAYGGTGEYDNNRVGRLLRNFTFSGKGLVDNPANPRSHITNTSNSNEVSSFAGTLATADELDISKEKFMSDISQEQFDALKSELEQLKASKAEEIQKEIETLTAKVADVEKVKVTALTELEASKEVAKAKDEKIEDLKKELTEAKDKLAEAEKTLQDQKIEAVNATRKAQLLEKEIDEERVSSLIEKFADLSDDIFGELLESLPAKKKEDDKEEKKNCDKEAKANNDGSDTDIDEAKASDDADMSSGGDDTQGDLCAKAASWLKCNVLRTTAGKKEEGE